MENGQKKKIKAALFIVIISCIVFLCYRFILPLILPFIFAYWIAKLMNPLVSYLKKHFKIPKSIGGGLTLFLFGGAIGISFFYLFKILIQQLNSFLKNIPIYQHLILNTMNSLCNDCDRFFQLASGATGKFINTNVEPMLDSVRGKIMPVMTEQALQALSNAFSFFWVLFIVIMVILMIVSDMESLKKSYENSMFYEDFHKVAGKLSIALMAYLRMQGIIIGIIACVCTLGLMLIHHEYALLFGIFIAVFDAFPILGSGLILVPYAIFQLISKNVVEAAILMTVYLLCQFIRQTMEPRLLGNKIGIAPVYTIISIYIGIKLYGVGGIFLGPLSLVTIRTIISEYWVEH